jgi:poly(3-hydroxybutyrate) depolymerase
MSNKEIDATSFLFNFFKRYSSPATTRSSAEIASTKNYLSPSGGQDKPKQVISKKHTDKKLISKKVVFEKRSYTKGKKQNTFYLTKPTNKSDKPGAIVIVFSSKAYTARNMHTMIGGSDYANHYNFLYIYPQWSGGNQPVSKQFDELFIHQLKSQFPMYAHRIFVLGFSDGGRAAQDYYCDYSFILTAVATANYAWRNRECSPATSRPMLVLQSKKDPAQPYKGSKTNNLLSFKQTINKLTVNFNPMIIKNNYIKGKDYRCGAWKDEIEKLIVVECSLDWGGHNLAGSKFAFDKKLGPHMKHFKAQKAIAGFFQNQKHTPFYAFHPR